MNKEFKLSGICLAIALINQPVQAYSYEGINTRWNYDATYKNDYQQTIGSYSYSDNGNASVRHDVNEVQNNPQILSQTPEQPGMNVQGPWYEGYPIYKTYNYQESRLGRLQVSDSVDDYNTTDSTQASRTARTSSAITQSGIVTRDAHTQERIDSSGNVISGTKQRTADTSLTFQADDMESNPNGYLSTSRSSSLAIRYNPQQAIANESSSNYQYNRQQNNVAYDKAGNVITVNGSGILKAINESSGSSKDVWYQTGNSPLSYTNERTDSSRSQSQDFYYLRDKNNNLVLGSNGQPIVLAADQNADGTLRQQNRGVEQWSLQDANTYKTIVSPVFSSVINNTQSSADKNTQYQPDQVLSSEQQVSRAQSTVSTAIVDGFETINQQRSNSKSINYNPADTSTDTGHEYQSNNASMVQYRTFKTDEDNKLLLVNGQPLQDMVYTDAKQTQQQQTDYKSGQLQGTLKNKTETMSVQGTKSYSDGFVGSRNISATSSVTYQQNLAKTIEVARELTDTSNFDYKDKVVTSVTSMVVTPGSVAVDLQGYAVTDRYVQSMTDANGQKKYYVVLGYDGENNEIRSEVKVDVSKAQLNEVMQVTGSTQKSEKVSQGEAVAYHKTSESNVKRTTTNVDDGFVGYNNNSENSETTLYSIGKNELDYQSSGTNQSDIYNRSYKTDAKGNKIIKDGKLVVESINHATSEESLVSKDYQADQVKKSETAHQLSTKQTQTDARDGFVSTQDHSVNLTLTQFNEDNSDKYSTLSTNETTAQKNRAYQQDEDGNFILVNGERVLEKVIQSTSSANATLNQYQIGQALKNDSAAQTTYSATVQNIQNQTTEVNSGATNELSQTYRQGQVLDHEHNLNSTSSSVLTQADGSRRDYQTRQQVNAQSYQTELGLLASNVLSEHVKQESTETLTLKDANNVLATQTEIVRGSEVSLNTDSSIASKTYGSETKTDADGSKTIRSKKATGITDKFGTMESATLNRTETTITKEGSSTALSTTRVDTVDGIKLTQEKIVDPSAGSNSNVKAATSTVVASTEIKAGEIKVGNVTLTADKGLDAGQRAVTGVGRGVADTDAANVGQMNESRAQAIASANTYTDSRVNQVSRKLDNVEKDAYRGVAIALAAQQAVPNIQPGQVAVFGGIGHYEGESAGSIGVVTSFTNRVSASGAFGFSGGGNFGGRVGVSYLFGGN